MKSSFDRGAERQTLPSRGTISQSLADRIAAEKTFKLRAVAITCDDKNHARLVSLYIRNHHNDSRWRIDEEKPVVYARIDSPMAFMLLEEEGVDIRTHYVKQSPRTVTPPHFRRSPSLDLDGYW